MKCWHWGCSRKLAGDWFKTEKCKYLSGRWAVSAGVCCCGMLGGADTPSRSKGESGIVKSRVCGSAHTR